MTETTRSSALTARARRYLTDALHAFEHAPVEVTLSVLLAIAFSYTLASDAEPMREWLEFAIVVVLAGATAFVATMLHALGALSTRTRWLITLAGAITAALYGWFLLDLQFEAQAWRAAALVAAAVLFMLGAPALADRARPTAMFRLVSGRLLLRTIGVLLYAAALFAGLALALGAVNTLFELDLNARVYFHTFGWIFIVLVTWVVMGGIPDYVRPEQDRSAVADAVHRMAAYLVTPLLAIYYIILYAYALRIAVTGELPKNLVSPLVIAAGLIAGLALVLFDRGGDSRLFRSLRAVAPLFIPLGLLGASAIIIRLNQYGWTEFRGLRIVLLVVLELLALTAVVNVVRRRPLRLHVLPLALAAALVIAVTGPWSVIAVSRRSQQARLDAALRDAGLDWNATVVRDSTIDSTTYRQVSETARYLATHFGTSALPPLFAQHAGPHDGGAYEAGLRPEQPLPGEARGGFARLEHDAVLITESGDTLHYVRIDRSRRIAQDTAAASYDVPLRIGGLQLVADIEAVANELAIRGGGETLMPGSARVELRDANDIVRGELFILEIGLGPGGRSPELLTFVGVARLIPGDVPNTMER